MVESTTPQKSNEQASNGVAGIAASKALEKVLVWIMYTAVVGSVVYFATRLQQVEATIAKHHGQGWEELKNIVQTTTLSGKITSSEQSLKQLLDKQEDEIKRLSSRIKSIEMWTLQGDVIMTERDKRKYKGHAFFTDDGTSERLCTVNYAHPNGRVFKINDRIKVINADSHREESTICTISGNAHDTTEPTVLLTLNKTTSKTLAFSKEIGRINIFASLADLPEDRRWKTVADYRKPPYQTLKGFGEPFAEFSAPAAGPR